MLCVHETWQKTGVREGADGQVRVSRLYCTNCGKETSASGSLAFRELQSPNYPICSVCGKAQRRTPFLRPRSHQERGEVDFARSLEIKAIGEATRCRLRVLVWGPTPNASGEQAKYATKRHQIKEALKAEGHDAYFSEDLVPRGTSIPMSLLELLQTREVDAVIDLATDFGPIGEAHEFGPMLGTKLLLWLPVAARKKFMDEGTRRYVDAAGGRSAFFEDRHLAACAITLASVDFVNGKRFLQVAIEEKIRQLQSAAPVQTRRS